MNDAGDDLLGAVAVLDACVLYPASLRDLFVTLAVNGLYLPKWTDTIHAEWIENLLERDQKQSQKQNHPPRLDRGRLMRSRDLMERACPRSLVTDYDSLISTLSLPDANDRHVLAAAIAAQADTIVTFNLSDFPASALGPQGVQALHPDIFLCRLFDQKPERFVNAIKEILERLKDPPRSWNEHMDILRNGGLPQLAARLSE